MVPKRFFSFVLSSNKCFIFIISFIVIPFNLIDVPARNPSNPTAPPVETSDSESRPGNDVTDTGIIICNNKMFFLLPTKTEASFLCKKY